MSIRVHHGDCLELMRSLAPVDAVVTDPPYGLEFMGQRWDSEGVAFESETWRGCFAALKSDSYLLAFGGTRTHHRMWCAIEDAGFVLQDTIMWLYGSGFPKGRTQLKPAYEPICVAYKPGGKRSLNIDECRIGTRTEIHASKPRAERNGFIKGFVDGTATQAREYGRWPANIAHDGSDEVMAGFPQTGISTGGRIGNAGGGDVTNVPMGRFSKGDPGFGDSGSAARFFYTAKADKDDRWGSHHPTVKPVALLKWLVALVTPAGGTVLDPFAGSGTTGVAALATGRNAILIEREAQYIADIEARLAHLAGEGGHSVAVKARRRVGSNALPLFENVDFSEERTSAS